MAANWGLADRIQFLDGTDDIGFGIEDPVFWIDRFHPHSVRRHTALS